MEYLETNFWWLLLLMSIVFIFAYKKLTKNPDAVTSKFEAKKKISGNLTDNLKFIEEALKNAGFKKVGLDKDENRFYAQTKFSMSSFSEYIEVSFSHDQFSTDLKFKSICALPTQVVAWGKNKRNYKKFERELEKLMPTSAIANAG
jgi:hypothetical protein